MYTISHLAKSVGLSRSTLLYYDRIGLLRPSGRNFANYRVYNKQDFQRLQTICSYREAGLSLEDIKTILKPGEDRFQKILKAKLSELREESLKIRRQQELVAGMLRIRVQGSFPDAIDKESFVSLLRSAGMDDSGMQTLHAEFERLAPKAHHTFLLSLGMTEEEVRKVRARSRGSLPRPRECASSQRRKGKDINAEGAEKNSVL